MVKLIIAVPQRKPAFPSRNRACLAMKLWQHGLLSIFAGMTCEAGATIKAAKSNLTVNCNFFMVARAAAPTQNSATVKWPGSRRQEMTHCDEQYQSRSLHHQT